MVWKRGRAMWAATLTIPLSPAVTSPFSRGTKEKVFQYLKLCTKNKNPPEGGTGGCCRRDAALFSPLDWGEGSAVSTPRANDVRPYDETVLGLWGVWVEYSVPGNRNSPEGGTGGGCCRKKNRFSPLDWGVRLSNEHVAG